MVGEDQQYRVRIIIEPKFNADVLEHIPIARDEFDLSKCKLELFLIWTIYEWKKLEFILEEDQMAMLGAFYSHSLCFDYARSL
jgi:hypothetical protein